MKYPVILWCILVFSSTLNAQMNEVQAQIYDLEPSITKHTLKLASGTISYTATTGYMRMTDEKGFPEANVFFIAYTKDGVSDPATRPVTFTFNGGPGSSSVWLHMGGLGPKRILMDADGAALPPPYEVVDNEYTWLGETDLVFIDPMMTGFTRPAGESKKEEFLGFNEDVQLVGDFIRLYTSKYERWNSPKFLAGESYGTTRAAGLSGYLQDRHGMYLNGIMLISAVLNFQTIRDHKGNDLPLILRFPTFAATSWYHGKVDKSKYPDLRKFLDEVEEFALGDYALALLHGDAMPDQKRQEIISRLEAYTGLSAAYLDQTNLRLFVGPYNKQLLRSEGTTVGRLDSRFKGRDYDNAGESYEFDPSYNKAIYGPFTMAINDYVRRDLKYNNDLPYEILTGRARPWNYSNVQNQYLNVSETLRNAMNKNPYLQVWVANGYYDLATPYFATEYVFNHMFLRGGLKDNVTMTYYESGHMMYIDKVSLVQFQKDLQGFIQKTMAQKAIGVGN